MPHPITPLLHNTTTIDPRSNLFTDTLLRVATVQKHYRRPVPFVSKRTPNRLIHRLHAHVLIHLIASSRSQRIRKTHPLLENHVSSVCIGHPHDDNTATQLVAEIDAFGETSPNNCKQQCAFLMATNMGCILPEHVLVSSTLGKETFLLVQNRIESSSVEKASKLLQTLIRREEDGYSPWNRLTDNSDFADEIAP